MPMVSYVVHQQVLLAAVGKAMLDTCIQYGSLLPDTWSEVLRQIRVQRGAELWSTTSGLPSPALF